MTTRSKICRICSSPAEYYIFDKIPAYLHGTSNEFINWQRPINQMLEETTGLKVCKGDGLPETICALCVSYMKHAVNFREQAINNAMNLKTTQLLKELVYNKSLNQEQKLKEKESVLSTAQDLATAPEREMDYNLLVNNCKHIQDKVCKQLLINFTEPPPSERDIAEQMRYLNLLFEKPPHWRVRPMHEIGEVVIEPEEDCENSTDDEHDGAKALEKENLFTYEEKCFEEDDILDTEELRDAIVVNIPPEKYLERKCPACFHRFMSEETHQKHTDFCIEYQFLVFVEEVTTLLETRRNKAISPHDYIRRMIFCLRKMCDWLKANCWDHLLPDLVAKQQPDRAQELNKIENNLQKHNAVGLPPTISFVGETGARSLLTPEKITSGTSTPINFTNNILYAIESSESCKRDFESNGDLINNGVKKPIAVLATNATPQNIEKARHDAARLTFLQKLQNACQTTPRSAGAATPISVSNTNVLKTPQTPQISVRKDLMAAPTPLAGTASRSLAPHMPLDGIVHLPSDMSSAGNILQGAPVPLADLPKPLTFSACCNSCGIIFEALAALEEHNATHHNTLIPSTQHHTKWNDACEEERNKIIALFENDGF